MPSNSPASPEGGGDFMFFSGSSGMQKGGSSRWLRAREKQHLPIFSNEDRELKKAPGKV